MRIPLRDHYQRGIPMKDREETIHVINTLLGHDDSGSSNYSNNIPLSGGNSNHNIDNEGSDSNGTASNKCDISSVYGEGPIILSNIPKSCYERPIILGIDEAGRGSVIGPMIYGMCYWDANAIMDNDSTTTSSTTSNENNRIIPTKIPKDFNDSKQLNEIQRSKLFDIILHSNDIGFGIRIFPSSEISRNMLRPITPYNLNQMSHNGTIALIRSLLQQQQHVQIQTCYIDTVGNASSYQYRLEQEFPGIEFIVESKADDTYPVCSAASIVAKVVRDRMIMNGQFDEYLLQQQLLDQNSNTSNNNNNNNISMKFGSGYPSDPICKEWLQQYKVDPIFTYPNLVRFSWGPIKKLLIQSQEQKQQELDQKKIIPVVFAADDMNNDDNNDDENVHQIKIGMKRQQEQMKLFLGKTKPNNDKMSKKQQPLIPYYKRRNIQPVFKL